jgi:hypothetical protein
MKMTEKYGKEITTMKKNKMMRVAAVMLVCVLLSTSIISGTFAKYVTEGSAGDKAHVARFGVVVSSDGYLFNDTYDLNPAIDYDGTGLTLAVSSATSIDGSSHLVAPGTSNADDPLTFSITGQPEVAVKITFSVTNTKDVLLPIGTDYVDYTKNPTGVFNTGTDYYPIKYTLRDANNAVVASCENVTLEQLATNLNAYTLYFDPGTDLSDNAKFGTYTLTWEWPFESGHDKEDTFLGMFAHDSSIDLPEIPSGVEDKFSIKAGVDIKITVTQVD